MDMGALNVFINPPSGTCVHEFYPSRGVYRLGIRSLGHTRQYRWALSARREEGVRIPLMMPDIIYVSLVPGEVYPPTYKTLQV